MQLDTDNTISPVCPQTVNAANALTFVLMIFTSWLTSSLIALTSVPIALAIGTTGYSVYAGGLYLSTKTDGSTTWLVIVGAAACGISAGWFWSTEGAVALSYPEAKNKAKYVSYWLMFRVMGQLVGGAINLGLNVNADQQGSVSVNTYIVFIVLQGLGPAFAMLLSSPGKVQRKDGTKVELLSGNEAVTNETGFSHLTFIRSEIVAVWHLLKKPQIYLLLPMIWQTTFSESLTGTYNVTYFTVRSRALGSFLSAVVASLANYLLGFYLDYKGHSVNTRAKVGFVTIYALQGGWWIFATYILNDLHKNPPETAFDWADQSTFPTYFALYLVLQIGFNVMYELTYVLICFLHETDPSIHDVKDGIDAAVITDKEQPKATPASSSSQLTRLASIIRGVESAGQALSYGLNSTTIRLDAIAGLNFGLYAVAVPLAWVVVRKIGLAKN